MRTEGIAAVMVHVAEVEAGMAWYLRAFPGAVRDLIDSTDFEILSLGGIQIEVVAADGKVQSGPAGSVVYWKVSEFEAALSHLLDLGATLHRGPMQIEGGQRMCQVQDPWGNCIGIRGPCVQPAASHTPLHPSTPILRIMQLKTARIFVTNLEAARHFYARTLGLPIKADGSPHGYCVFEAGAVDLVVETVPNEAPDEDRALVGRFTGLSFTVQDVQAKHLELAALGVPFSGLPEQQFWGGVLATFQDPAGNMLQLVQHPGAT